MVIRSLLLYLFIVISLFTYSNALSHIVKERKRLLQQKFDKAYQETVKLAPKWERQYICEADGYCFWRGLQGSLASGHGLQFCHDCRDVHMQGLFMETWESFYSPREFHVDGEIVWAVPNDASSPLINAVGDAIVLVKRGRTPLSAKAHIVQNAGALAIIVIDDGTCSEDFQCPKLGSKSEGYLAHKDSQSAWEGIRIPMVLVTKSQGDRLIELMNKKEFNIEGHGIQMYTAQ